MTAIHLRWDPPPGKFIFIIVISLICWIWRWNLGQVERHQAGPVESKGAPATGGRSSSGCQAVSRTLPHHRSNSGDGSPTSIIALMEFTARFPHNLGKDIAAGSIKKAERNHTIYRIFIRGPRGDARNPKSQPSSSPFTLFLFVFLSILVWIVQCGRHY